MADVNKSVEIQLNVKATGLDKIHELIGSFTKLQDVAKQSQQAATAIKDAFSSITIPSTLQDALNSLSNITIPPGLSQFADGLKKLQEATAPKNLSEIAASLKELDGIRLPSLKAFVTNLQNLSSADLNMKSLSARLRSVKKLLEGFQGMRMPNLKGFTDALVRLSSISLGDLEKARVNLKGFVSAMQSVEAINPSKITELVQQLIKFSYVKPSPNLDKIIEKLKELSGLRVPNLKNITSAFYDLKKLTDIPSLSNVAKELKKLDGIKITVPNLKILAEGLQLLGDSSIKAYEATAKLRVLFRTLKRAPDVKVPNLKTFAEGIQILSTKSANAATAAAKLRDLQKALEGFTGVKVPNLRAFAEGVATLSSKSLDVSQVAPKLKELQKALEGFTSIKVPNVRQLASAVEMLAKLDVSQLKTVAENIKILGQALPYLKGAKVPNMSQFAKGVQELAKVGGTQIKTAAENIRKVAEALKALRNVSVPNVAGFASGLKKIISLDVGKLIAKIKELDAALEKLGKIGGLNNFSKFASDLNKVASSVKNVTKATKPAYTTLGGFLRKLKSYSQYRVVADSIIGIKNVIMESIQAVAEYDQALKDLQAITQSTDQEVAAMGETIDKVAATTKFSTTEVAAGMKTLGQAGLTASESIQTIQNVANLATGTLSDMSMAVDLVTTAMRVFDKDATQTGEIVDVFANAINRSKLTVNKLKTAINYVGPVAKEAGLSLEDLNAAMMSLANSGIRASSIGTGLRRVLAELVAPSKKFKQAVAEAGVSIESLDPRVNSFSDVVQNLKFVVNDAQVAFEAFGKRGATAVLALTQDGVASFDAMMQSVTKSGVAAEMAQKQMEGLAVSFKNLKDKLGLFVIKLGELGITDVFKVLVDALRAVITVLTRLIDNDFARFIAKTVVFSTAVLAVVATLVKLKSALAVTTEIAVFTAGMNSATTAIATFEGIMGGFATKIASFIAILRALAPVFLAVAVAVGVLIKVFENLKAKQEEADSAMTMADQFDTLVNSLDNYKKQIAGLDKDSDAYANTNKKLRESLLDVAHGNTEAAAAAAKAAQSINPLTGAISDNGNALKEYEEVLNNLKFQKLAEATNAAEENLKRQTGNLQRFIDSAKDLGSMAMAAGSDLLDAFLAGISGHSDQARSAFIRTIKDPWDILVKSFNASELADKVNDGTASFKELQDYVNSLDFSRLTAVEKTVVDAFNLMDRNVSKSLKSLMEMNDLDFSASVDDIRQVAETSGLSEKAIEDLIAKFKQLKESSQGQYANIFEKWADDAKKSGQSMDDLIKKVEDYGIKLTDTQKESLATYDQVKKKLVEQYQQIKKNLEVELKSGKDKKQAYLDFYEKERALLDKSRELNRKYAEDTARLLVEGFSKIDAELHKTLEDINATWKRDSKLWAKHVVDAVVQAEKQKELLVKKLFDPNAILKEAKDQAKIIKDSYALMFKEIQQQVMLGNKSAEQGAVERKILEKTMATELSALWQNTYTRIAQFAGESATQAKEAMLQETEVVGAAIQKIMQEMKQASTQQKQIASELSGLFKDSFSGIFDGVLGDMSLQPLDKFNAIIDNITNTLRDGLTNLANKKFKIDDLISVDPTKSIEKIKSFLRGMETAFTSVATKRISIAEKAAEIEARVTGDVVKAEEKAAKEIEKIQEDLYKTKISFYKKAKDAIIQALEASIAKENEIIDKIKKIQDAAKSALETLESKKSDLKQSLMSEIKKYRDDISKFREAMREGSALEAAGKYKEAIDKYKEAGDIAAKTAREVKDGEMTIISKAGATKNAIKMVEEAERAIKGAEESGTDVLGKQLENQHKKTLKLYDALVSLTKVLENLDKAISKQRAVKIDADFSELDALDDKIKGSESSLDSFRDKATKPIDIKAKGVEKTSQEIKKIKDVYTNLKSETEKPIDVKTNEEEAIASIDQVKSALKELKSTATEAINVDLTTNRSKQEVDALVKAVAFLQEKTNKPINLILGKVDESNIEDVIQRVGEFNKKLNEMNGTNASVDISIETNEAWNKLSSFASQAEDLVQIDGSLDITTDEAQNELNSLATEAGKLFDNIDSSNIEKVIQSATAALNTVIREQGGQLGVITRGMLDSLQEFANQYGYTVKIVTQGSVDIIQAMDAAGNEVESFRMSSATPFIFDADNSQVMSSLEKIPGVYDAVRQQVEEPIKIDADTTGAKEKITLVDQYYKELKAQTSDKIVVDLTTEHSKQEIYALAEAVLKLQEETGKEIELKTGGLDELKSVGFARVAKDVGTFTDALIKASNGTQDISDDFKKIDNTRVSPKFDSSSLNGVTEDLNSFEAELLDVDDMSVSPELDFSSLDEATRAYTNLKGLMTDTINVLLSTDQSKQEIDALVDAAAKLQMETGKDLNIKVNVDGEEVKNAQKVVDAFKEEVKKVNTEKVTPQLDSSELKETEDTAKKAKEAVDKLGNSNVTPKVDAGPIEKIEQTLIQAANATEEMKDKTIKFVMSVFGKEDAEELKETIDSTEDKEIKEKVKTSGKDDAEELKETIDDTESKNVSVDAKVTGGDDVGDLVAIIDELKDKTVKIVAKVEGIDKVAQLAAKINALHNKTVTVTYVEKHQGGGGTGYASGGSVFPRPRPYINRGSGVRDDVPAMLMKGEYVINKKVVNQYGKSFFDALNYGLIDIRKHMPKFASGGLVDTLRSYVDLPMKSGGSVFDVKHPSFYRYLMKKLDSLHYDSSTNVAVKIMGDTFQGSPHSIYPSDLIKRFEPAIFKMQKSRDFQAITKTVQDMKNLSKIQSSLAYALNRNVIPAKNRKTLDSNFIAVRQMISEIPENAESWIPSVSPLFESGIAEAFASGGYVSGIPIVHLATGGYVSGAFSNFTKVPKKKKKGSDLCATTYAAIATKKFDEQAAEFEKRTREKIQQFRSSMGLAKGEGFGNVEDYLATFKKEVNGIILGMQAGGDVEALNNPNEWFRQQKALLDAAFKEDLVYLQAAYIEEQKSTIAELGATLHDKQVELQTQINDIKAQMVEELAGLVKECQRQMESYELEVTQARQDMEEAIKKARADANQDIIDANLDYQEEIAKINNEIEQVKKNMWIPISHIDGSKTMVKNPKAIAKVHELETQKKYAKEKHDNELQKIRSNSEFEIKDAKRDFGKTVQKVELDKKHSSEKTKFDENKVAMDAQREISNAAATANPSAPIASAKSALRKSKIEYTHNVNTRKIQYEKDLLALQLELAQKLKELQGTNGKSMTITHWMNTGGFIGKPAGSVSGKDSILAMLAPDEYVINASAVRRFGTGFFDKLNNLEIPKFINGGSIVDKTIQAETTPSMTARLELALNDSVFELGASPDVAQRLLGEWTKARLRTV